MRKLFIGFIRGYQTLLSPLLPFNHCRYYPSCSEYTVEAVEKHGPVMGSFLGIRRVLRCHPFSRRDIYDPVPDANVTSRKG